MRTYMTPEERARLHRRRWRQLLGLFVALLIIIGAVTVVRAAVGAVYSLFDDTEQRQEFEDKLDGLVLFDPLPFDGVENIDDLTLREASVWGTVYSILETQGSFDAYSTDPDTEELMLPSVEVDAYLAKLFGPSFKLTHRTFEMEDMTIEYDSTAQCYKIPITGSVGYYHASVADMFKKNGILHVTVGYVPIQSLEDNILSTTADTETPVKYMDYLFTRQSGGWYLTGLAESDTVPEAASSSAAEASASAPAEEDLQQAILSNVDEGTAASSASSEAAAQSAASEQAASSEAAAQSESAAPSSEAAASAGT